MGRIHGTTRLQRYWQFIATFPGGSLLKGAEEKDIHLPSSKLTWQWKFTFSTIGNTSSNGGFSIAMLVYRRVFQGNLGYVKYHNLARYMDDVFFGGGGVVQPRKCEV